MPVWSIKLKQYILPRSNRDTLVILLLTIALALCIKLFYSTAGPDDLKWVLLPTTALVEGFSSISFLFDPQKGYVAIGLPVVIGPGCAGLNFYVIALCMCSFSFIRQFEKHKLYWFLGFILITYVITLCVNAFRIVSGLILLELGGSMNFAVSDMMHTMQGTLFYFVFLVVYFVALQVILKQRSRYESIH